MASLVLAGNTSGSITISSPSVSGSNTLTLPANTGTVLTTGSTFAGTGPAFSAYLGTSQTLGSGSFTKITINTEEFDTNSNFDNATNYRFTPTVAGYYQINGSVTANTSATTVISLIYKNGSQAKWGSYTGSSNSSIVSALIYMNGTTDYIELYGFFTAGQAVTVDASQTYFQAFLARSA
jgi:hypothetical protein